MSKGQGHYACSLCAEPYASRAHSLAVRAHTRTHVRTRHVQCGPSSRTRWMARTSRRAKLAVRGGWGVEPCTSLCPCPCMPSKPHSHSASVYVCVRSHAPPTPTPNTGQNSSEWWAVGGLWAGCGCAHMQVQCISISDQSSHMCRCIARCRLLGGGSLQRAPHGGAVGQRASA